LRVHLASQPIRQCNPWPDTTQPTNPPCPLLPQDIPLLYETRGEGACDGIAVVSAPTAAQRARVLARPGMSEEKFEAILKRQVRGLGLLAGPAAAAQRRPACGTIPPFPTSLPRHHPLTPPIPPSRPAHQVPDEEKRRRADFVIDTGCSLAETEAAVGDLVSRLAALGGRGAFRRALEAAGGGGEHGSGGGAAAAEAGAS
jgi:hypothetical protein